MSYNMVEETELHVSTREMLQLTVINASQLRKTRSIKVLLATSKTTCYATISVDGVSQYKTRHSQGTDPQWNETFDLAVTESSNIKLAVFYRSPFSQDILIGEALLAMKDVAAIGVFERIYALQRPGSKHPDRSGSISIRLHFTDFRCHALNGRQESEVSSSSNNPEAAVKVDVKLPQEDNAVAAANDAVGAIGSMAREKAPSTVGNLRDSADFVENVTKTTGFALVCGHVETLLKMGDTLSEIHPWASLAWSILSVIPKSLIAQLSRDQKLQDLWSTAADMFDFLKDAKQVFDEFQLQTVSEMMKQIYDCAVFVREYAGKGFFKRSLRDTMHTASDTIISQYTKAFAQLKERFESRTMLSTLKIFRDVRQGVFQIEEDLKEIERTRLLDNIPGTDLVDVRCDENRVCLPKTREMVLKDVMQWVADPASKRVFWLHGVAGAGKSTIANTIAARFTQLKRLGASFRFDRVIDGRNIPTFLIGNIAYQLARFSTTYRELLFHAVDMDGKMNLHSLRAQLQKYVIAPTNDVAFSGPIVMIIDALDESGTEEARRDLLEALAEELPRLPAFFKILLVSRDEIDIRAHLQPISLSVNINMAPGTADDIQVYIGDQLAKIRQRHSYLSPDWPGQTNKNELSLRADGLFIWATVASNYIKCSHDPDVTLYDVLSGGESFPGTEGPETPLDGLYIGILQQIFPRLPATGGINYFQYIIGSIVVAKMPLNQAGLDSLLGLSSQLARNPLLLPDGSLIKLSTSRSLIASLGSILRVDDRAVRLLHLSVADFLTNPLRCTDSRFFVNKSTHNRFLAYRCFETMQAVLRRDICQVNDPSVLNSKISDLEERFEKYVPDHAQYACKFWPDHLIEVTSEDNGLYEQAKIFLFTHLLHWIEVKSLQGQTDDVFSVLRNIKLWFQGYSKSDNAIELIDDALQFMRHFYDAIRQSASHIYISAIPFTPPNSVLFKCYAPKLLNIPRLLSTPSTTFNLITLRPEQGSPVVAVSPDCSVMAYTHDSKTIQIWDIRTCSPVATLEAQLVKTSRILTLRYSYDGTYVCAGDGKGVVYLWNAATFHAIGTLFELSDADSSVQEISITGNHIIVLHEDQRVAVWDIASRKRVACRDLGGGVRSITLRGAFILPYTPSIPFRAVDAFTGEDIGSKYYKRRDIHQMAMSLDGKIMAYTGHDGNNIKITDCYTGDTNSFSILEAAGIDMTFSDSGSMIVTYFSYFQADQKCMPITVYHCDSGNLAGPPIMTGRALCVTISFDETYLLKWSSDDNRVEAFDITTGTSIAMFTPDSHRTKHIFVSSSINRLVSIGGSVSIWDLALLQSPNSESRAVVSVLPSPTSSQIIVVFSDDSILVSNDKGDPMSGTVLQGAHPPTSFSPDGAHIVTASATPDHVLRLWKSLDATSVEIEFCGQHNPVTALAFSEDGCQIASAFQGNSIHFWDIASGKEIQSPLQWHSEIQSISFLSDVSKVLCVSGAYEVEILDVKTGLATDHIIEPSWRWARFSLDGSQVLCVSQDGQSRFLYPETGQLIHKPIGTIVGRIEDFSLSPNQSHAISASRTHGLHIEDTSTGILSGPVLKNFPGKIISLAFSCDGRKIAIGSEAAGDSFFSRGYVGIWDSVEGVLVWKSKESQPITSVAFSRTGKQVVHVSMYWGDIHLRDSFSGATVSILKTWRRLRDLSFSSDETQVIGVTKDEGQVVKWNIPPEGYNSWQEEHVIHGEQYPETDVSSVQGNLELSVLSPDQTRRAVPDDESFLTLHDLKNSASEKLLELSKGHTLKYLIFSPDALKVACTTSGHTIHVWDISTKVTDGAHHVEEDTAEIISLQFSQNSTQIIFVVKWQASPLGQSDTVFYPMNDNPKFKTNIRIWDVVKNSIVCGADSENIYHAAISPDSTRVLSVISGGDEEGELQIWDTSLKNLLSTHILHSGDLGSLVYRIDSMTFNPDSTELLLQSQYGTHLLDYPNLEALPTFGTNDLGGASFSPDGKCVAYFNRFSRKIRIISCETRAPLCEPLSTYLESIASISFSSDSARLLALSDYGNVYVWNIEKYLPLLQATSTFTANRTVVCDQTRHMSHQWYLGQNGVQLVWLPDSVVRVWLATRSGPRGLILEFGNGQLVKLDMEEFLETPKIGCAWRKGGIRYVKNSEEVKTAHILAYLACQLQDDVVGVGSPRQK